MVKLNKIYTRTGDKGETGLLGGIRVRKEALRVAAYGDVDETNSMIGIARCHTRSAPEWDAMLSRIQHDLFDLGADLAKPERKESDLRIIGSQVERLEKEIDQMNAALAPLNSFVLPGGTDLAATLHFVRTVARRAERSVCALATKEDINPLAIEYINRLSDHLFVMARAVNHGAAGDVLWQPGVNR